MNTEIKRINMLIKRYPGKVPIKLKSTNKEVKLKKSKLLINCEFTIGQFIEIVRNQCVDINKHQAIYILLNNEILVPSSNTLDEI